MTVGSFALQFTDFMPHTVRVEHWLGTFDSYGNPQRGGLVEVQCMIEEQVRNVRDAQGQDRVSMTTLYLAAGPINANDKITMPTEFTGRQNPPIISVSNVSDESGFDHAEVYL